MLVVQTERRVQCRQQLDAQFVSAAQARHLQRANVLLHLVQTLWQRRRTHVADLQQAIGQRDAFGRLQTLEEHLDVVRAARLVTEQPEVFDQLFGHVRTEQFVGAGKAALFERFVQQQAAEKRSTDASFVGFDELWKMSMSILQSNVYHANGLPDG